MDYMESMEEGVLMTGKCRKEDRRLTYIRSVGLKKHKSYALYRCSCGKLKVLQKYRVDSGETRSCGCLRIEKALETLSKIPREKKAEGGRKSRTRLGSGHKGKVRITDPETGRFKYVSPGRADALFYGLDGEVEPSWVQPTPWNKDKKKVDGEWT